MKWKYFGGVEGGGGGAFGGACTVDVSGRPSAPTTPPPATGCHHPGRLLPRRCVTRRADAPPRARAALASVWPSPGHGSRCVLSSTRASSAHVCAQALAPASPFPCTGGPLLLPPPPVQPAHFCKPRVHEQQLRLLPRLDCHHLFRHHRRRRLPCPDDHTPPRHHPGSGPRCFGSLQYRTNPYHTQQ